MSRIVYATGVTVLLILTIGIFLMADIESGLDSLGHDLIPIGEAAPFWTYPLLAYVLYFVGPTILFLPILLPEALTWRDPRRIVVFRRFKTRERNRALRRIATRHLGRFGHVFTLADQRIHRSWFSRIPALFGQLSFVNFRPQTVTNERRLNALNRILAQRSRLNLNWLVSARKIFPIRSSDEYWQACVRTLLDQADAVVMEVSDFSASLSWELHECERRGLLDRTILVAEHDHADSARAELHAVWAGSGLDSFAGSLFLYRGAAIEDAPAFEQRVAEICRGREVSSANESRLRLILSSAMTLVVSVVLASIGIVACGPYLWPHETAQYSPFKAQVLTAYFVTGDKPLLSRIMTTDREWTLDHLRRELADPRRGHYAANALRDLGDEGDIALLVDYLGRQPPQTDDSDVELGWFRFFTPTAISRNVDQESLRVLAKRFGDRGLVLLVDALAKVPQLPFDSTLYFDYVQDASAHAPDELFVPLIAAPSEAARLTAALVLAPRRNIRAVPGLLGGVRTGAKISGLDGVLHELEGVPGLQGEWLDPYILDDDDAAEAAARLAIASPDPEYVTRLVEHLSSAKGRRILGAATTLVAIGGPAVARAHAVLAHANPAWTRTLRADRDPKVRAAAIYADAERGDVSLVADAVSLGRLEGTCDGLLGRYSCRPYEDDAVAALDLLRKRLHPPASVAFTSAELAKSSAPLLASLIKVVVIAGDNRAIDRMVQEMRADGEPFRSALESIGEDADPQLLRAIVRVTPPGASTGTDAFVAGLAAGLPWENRADLCAIAASEHRSDLVRAIDAATGRCR